MPEAPFNRACSLLEDRPPPAAISALAPFLEDGAERIRKDAALIIGAVGAPEALVSLRTALKDRDEYVRSSALIGLARANEAGRLDVRCRTELIAVLTEMLVAGHNAGDAAPLLVDYDAEAATAFFLSADVFRAGSPILHEGLRALAAANVRVPREQLRKLVGELESGELEYPRDYALAEALRLLGVHQFSGDREFLEARIQHSNDVVARGAAEGLLALFDFRDVSERVWNREKEAGRAALTQQERLYTAVLAADGEINNGGLSQYFFNSSGDSWQDALAGFASVGCPERTAILREAIGRFGPKGPSTDRDRRQNELASITRRNEKIFDELDSRYYACRESVDVGAARYVIQNAEAFRSL